MISASEISQPYVGDERDTDHLVEYEGVDTSYLVFENIDENVDSEEVECIESAKVFFISITYDHPR